MKRTKTTLLVLLTAALVLCSATASAQITPLNYRWPVSNSITHVWQWFVQGGHTGVDIRATSGTPILAAASGRVVRAVTGHPNAIDASIEWGRGNHVVLWHRDGLATSYQHLDGTWVATLHSWVECGTQIGSMGRSGNTRCDNPPDCDSTHLHFEARINTNPEVWDDPDEDYQGGSAVNPNVNSTSSCDPNQPANVAPVIPGGGTGGGGVSITGDNAAFETETLEDRTIVAGGSLQTKRWTVRNTGTTTWSTTAGYQLVFDNGDQNGGAGLVGLPRDVRPGETVDFTVSLRIPTASGTYRGAWRMAHGTQRFGDWYWYELIVASTTGGRQCWSPTLQANVQDGECVQVSYGGCGASSCGWYRCANGRFVCHTGTTCPARLNPNAACTDGGGGVTPGGCACTAGLDNYCSYRPNTAGCPMTARGGYCDPDSDGSFSDANWIRGYEEYRASCGSTPGTPPPPPPPPPPSGSCSCRSGVDNYCLLGVNVAGCAMTQPGGYCDPNGDGSFSDADWTRGFNEYRSACGGGSPPPPPPPPPPSGNPCCRSGVDNFCLIGVNVSGCAMTQPGGYCDPNGDGSFSDGDWTRGYNEFQAACR